MLLQAKRYKTAEDTFNRAIDILNSDSENILNDANDNIPANKGLAKTLILQNKFEEAAQFLSFLNELTDSFDIDADDNDSSEKRKFTAHYSFTNHHT